MTFDDLPGNYVVSRLLSGFAGGTLSFALSLWMYKSTGTYSAFAWMVFASEVPSLLLAPFLGTLVDYSHRRRILIACDVVGLALVSITFILAISSSLSPTIVGGIVVLLAITRVIGYAAAPAAVAEIVDQAERPRINGLLESGVSGIGVVGPIVGVAIFEIAGLHANAAMAGLLLVSAIAIMAKVPFPARKYRRLRTVLSGGFVRGLSQEYFFGFRWIWHRPNLLRLTIFFMVLNLGASIYVTATAPYLLSVSSPEIFAICSACMSAGAVFGGLLISFLSAERSYEKLIAVGATVVSIVLIGIGLCRQPLLLPVLSALYGFCVPLINASNEIIWQARVPVEYQGRVFAVRRMVGFCFKPFTVLLSIPLVADILLPLMNEGSTGSLLTSIWGHGLSGTLGLLISLCGFVQLAALPLLTLRSKATKMIDGTEEIVKPTLKE